MKPQVKFKTTFLYAFALAICLPALSAEEVRNTELKTTDSLLEVRRQSSVRDSKDKPVVLTLANKRAKPRTVTHQAPTKLTLDRLFRSDEFLDDRLGYFVWSKLSPSYFTLKSAGNRTEGDQLIRVNNETGQQTIVATAAQLTPASFNSPLKIDRFQLSPDESRVLIYTNSQKVWRYNTRGDYWVLDLRKGQLQKLGGEIPPSSMMFAKFSPDGNSVGYLHENNIYVQQLADLGITAITTDGSPTLINGTSDWVNEEELSLRDCFRFSPDSQSILFWQFDTTGVRQFHLLDNTTGKYPRLISFPYPKVGETNSSTRIGIVSTQGGEVRWLQIPGDQREHYIPQAEWTPDGSKVLVQQLNRLQNSNRVFLCNRETGSARHFMTESDPAWLENDNPVRWLQSGQCLLWLSERSDWRHAWIAPLNGQQHVPVTQGEYDLIEVRAIDEANGWLYFIASPENATQRYLYRIALSAGLDDQPGTPERLTPANQPGWHQYNISPDAQWAIHSWSTFMTPPSVELIRLHDHSVTQVLMDNAELREKLKFLSLPSLEFVKLDIGNEIVLDGWCLKPSHFDPNKKYPLLVHVYGEPHGTTVTDAWKGTRGLWHWMLAEQGCIVVSFDNRGTYAPRGRAWRKCVYRKIGILAPPEQAAAVEKLLSDSPYIDQSRIGIWGWSGGGSMSLNAIFRYPELYKTAIAVAPNPSQLLYDTIYQERYMGLPDDNTEGYREGSPITHAHLLRGNLLLVHGTGDDNGHYQGTELLMNELIAQGKHFSVMPYPYRSHSIKEGENTVRHFWGYLTTYLQEHLLSEGTK